MKRLKVFFFLLPVIQLSSKIYGQFGREQYYSSEPWYYEAGVGLGVLNCITDVGGANGEVKYYFNEIKAKNFRFSGSLYGSIVYHNFIGARLEVWKGQIRSADSDIKGNSIYALYKRNRNLSFKSNITDISLLFDFRPLAYLELEPRRGVPEPYVTTGLTWFSFKPKTLYEDRWVDLKPLHTEGEGFPEYPAVSEYSLKQLNIPIGLGIRYRISERLHLRLEYVHHILFTDYLDDASSQKFINPDLFDKYLPPASVPDAKALFNRTINGRTPPRRGNPENHDTYMSISLKLGIMLGGIY